MYRSLEGINAVVVGMMWAASLYLLKDISILHFNVISIINLLVITGTFLTLSISKIPSPFIVALCLMFGWIL